MICKNCSAEFEGKICPECGAPAEQETVTEQVAQPVSEAAEPVEEILEPVTENDDVVTETLTPPTAVDGEIPFEPVPEMPEEACCESTVCDDCYEEPKKKKGKAGIIIAIIAVILIAAFCVVSFTDLVFSREAQFVSVLKNMGAESTEFDVIESDYLQANISVDVKSDNELLKDAPTDVLDVINSISLGMKYNLDDDTMKAIMTIYENDKELTNASVIFTDNETIEKFGFSDIAFKIPFGMGNTDIAEEQLERLVEELEKEIISVLEKNEPVKGEYNGGFDLGMKASTLTVSLNEQETTDLINRLIKITFKELELESEDYPAPTYDGKTKISVSALYTGAFSFARKSLGISIIVDSGEEPIEFLFFSNKENKAMYGAYCEGESLVVTDNFEIKNGVQSGKLTFSTNIADDYDLEELKKISATYTLKRNDFEAKISYADEDYPVDVTLSMKNENGTMKYSIRADYKSKEIGTLTMEYKPCEEFDFTINESTALDITKDSLTMAEEIRLETFKDDFMDFLEKGEDSTIISLLNSLINPVPETEFEKVFYDAGLEYYPEFFYASESAAFVLVMDDGSIDLQEFGYDGDIVKELTETYYLPVDGYSPAEQQAMLASLENTYAGVSSLDDAWVDCYLDDDYLIVLVQMMGLDDVQNLKAFAQAGLINLSSSNATQLSYKQTEALLIASGYIKAE